MRVKEMARKAKIDKLYAHKLLAALENNMRPMMETVGDIEWENDPTGEKIFKPKHPPSLTEEQNYHWSIFWYASNILGALHRLEEVQIYLTNFPRPRTYEKLSITEDKWIYYHFSNHIITMASFYDTALNLTNTVFTLGLEPRDCNDKTVTNNGRVRRTKVNMALKNLYKITEHYREKRNSFLHRWEIPKIGLLQVHELHSFLQLRGTSPFDANQMKKLYKLARRKIVKNLKEETKVTINAISNLFDALYPIYLSQLAQKKVINLLKKAVTDKQMQRLGP